MFPKENLLAFWKLDNLTDSRGNRYTLTNVNGVTFALGKIGQGAVFQLGRSLEALFSPPVPYASGNFSVSCWLKLNTLTGGGKFGADGTGGAFSFNSLPDGTVLIGNNSGNNAIVSSDPGAITTGQWYHLCGVSSNGVVSFYLNGNLIGSNSHTFTSAPKISIAYTYNDNVTDGMFDAVGIWDRPLTLQEVQALYNNGNGLEPEGILFLEDSSTNNFQLSAFGNAQISTSVKKYGDGSALFDGNGDYLQLPDDSDLVMGSGDFTVEAWHYPTALADDNGNAIIGSNSPGGFQVGWKSSTEFGVANSFVAWEIYTYAPPLNQWTHIAVSRQGSTMRMFYNGVLVVSGNINTDYTAASRYIGGWSGYPAYLAGYIDDLRVTKGIARYTSNFTPPQQQLPAPSDQYGEDVSLLLHMDGADGSTTFTDSSINNFALTAFGDAEIDTTTKKFGSGAALFDGSEDYLEIAGNSTFDFYNTNYTVEMWVFSAASQSGGALITTRLAGIYSPWELQITSSNKIGLLIQNGSSSWYQPFGGAPIVGNTTIPQNQWTHIAWVCNGANTTVYVNGVADSVLINLNTPILQAHSLPSNIYIGKGGDGAFNGYIDELRITKGIARYTANFVPQTAPFANPVPAIPTDGLLVRFNADSGISESSGNITSWTDQQNGVVATAFNNPTLLTNEFNGRKAVSFNGSNTYFTFTFPTPISNGAPRTFVVIGRYNNPTSTGQQGYLNSTAGDLCYVFKNASEDRSYYYTEARQMAGPTAASSSSLASYHVQTVVHNGIPNSNFIRINGVTSYNISYGTMDNLPQLANIVIGGRGTPSEILSGQIVEILVYNRELSSEEITQIETYANI
jgi:hypothetical protein